MTAPKLTVIGGGKMGEALVGGLISGSWASADEILVVEPVEARRDELVKAHKDLAVSADATTAGPDVLVAVKPDHVEEVCRGLDSVERVISIAAGVTTASMESWLPEGVRVVRVMPNTPAMVGKGMAAAAAGALATGPDLDWAAEILAAVGEVVIVDEAALDAVTAVSGSGPAYVFLLAEALRAAGVSVGLDEATADLLTRQTLLGAAHLLSVSGEDPAVLRENVTSPGGTTAAALAVFEDRDLRGIVEAAVAAADARSRELGA